MRTETFTQHKKPNLTFAQAVASGVLEIDQRHGGFLRQISIEMQPKETDPHINFRMIDQMDLRPGSMLECLVRRQGRGGPEVARVLKINGKDPMEWMHVDELPRRTAIDPNQRLTLSTTPTEVSMRIMDLFCPVGKGQRALIVAPPKTGKTILMQQMANAISINHPEVHLIVLLVDERPEEVTDMRRSIKGEVFASSNDSERESHARLSRFVLEYAKRKVEVGKDVVILLDSLTRLGRAFNLVQQSSGRTLSGGIDARALEIPKRIFGAARALEGGGSLTIVATALIETNSRMDELIFQEFKGTGNMEVVLDRDLANERIFPAINIPESGTRREELLFGRDTGKHQALRRALHRMKPKEAMLNMLKAMESYPTNRKLLAKLTNTREDE
ncbi:MAG: transcription termination factor Rho [Ignavibacteriae bacterium]|nr:transcription termination factor Rho [Ignavibacteriota bacterium]